MRSGSLSRLLGSHSLDTLDDALDEWLDEDDWADATTGALVAEPFTQGLLAGFEKRGIERVEFVAADGCDFCAEYDGRILTVGVDESGMPPLHNGCNCDISPLND